MQKYKAIIEYVGTNYCGMQKQKDCNIKSIQGVVEDAISKFANTKIEIDYSGRTDPEGEDCRIRPGCQADCPNNPETGGKHCWEHPGRQADCSNNPES